MGKPEYANAFTVSTNPNTHEVIITFLHEYQEAVYSQETGISFQEDKELISSVVLAENGIASLLALLQDVLEQAKVGGKDVGPVN